MSLGNLAENILSALEKDQGRKYIEELNCFLNDLSIKPNKKRFYMGASGIGHPCARKLWLDYFGIYDVEFTGRQILIFNNGHLEEARFLALLASIDLDIIYGDDPALAFEDGVLKGHADCIINSDTLAEFKTCNDSMFKQFVKNGVLESKIEYFVQMQVYMHYLKLPEAVFLAMNKNTQDLYSENIAYSKDHALHYINRAKRVTQAQQLPPGIDNKMACNMCPYREPCKEDRLQVTSTCRNCEHDCKSEEICSNYRRIWFL